MNARGTPANVFSGHAPNELTDFRWDRPATTPPVVARFLGPKQAKTLAVPTHQGVGLEDVQSLETTRPDAVQPDPAQALASTQTHSFAISLSDHGQLLPKREDFHVEHGAASEDTAQRSEQRAENGRQHRKHANAGGPKKSTETTGTGFLVGTAHRLPGTVRRAAQIRLSRSRMSFLSRRDLE